MACSLTQGKTVKACKTPSGTKYLLLIEKDNVTSITKTAGVVTAITLVAAKLFFKYQAKQEIINWKETTTVANGAYATDQEINIDLVGLDQVTKTELSILKKATLIAVCVDNDDTAWYFGEVNGMDLVSNAAEGGTTYDSFRGNKLQFKGREAEESPSVTVAILAALTT